MNNTRPRNRAEDVNIDQYLCEGKKAREEVTALTKHDMGFWEYADHHLLPPTDGTNRGDQIVGQALAMGIITYGLYVLGDQFSNHGPWIEALKNEHSLGIATGVSSAWATFRYFRDLFGNQGYELARKDFIKGQSEILYGRKRPEE